MRIDKLLGTLNSLCIDVEPGKQPEKFRTICIKEVMADPDFYKENFFWLLADMTPEKEAKAHDNFKCYHDDIGFMAELSQLNTTTDYKLIATYAASVSLYANHFTGLIHEAYLTGVMAHVDKNMSVWWDDLCSYVYDADQRYTHESLERDGEL
jgi:hypothetical protein